MLIDTHAHPHFKDFDDDREQMLERAQAAGVGKILCVGVDVETSQAEVEFVQTRANLWASVGLHPHDAKLSDQSFQQLKQLATQPKVAAIGECGLDYHYNHSSPADQLKALRFQIELALELGKPSIFHVRNAFDDFFNTIRDYQNISGVVHCFSSDEATLNKVLDQGLYVGLGGIITFTKDQAQLEAAKACALDRMLLETDSPFLAPVPNRGKRNEPANLRIIAEFLAELRGESFDELAAATTSNAEELFGI